MKIPVFQTRESGFYLGSQKDRCKRYLRKFCEQSCGFFILFYFNMSPVQSVGGGQVRRTEGRETRAGASETLRVSELRYGCGDGRLGGRVQRD